MGCVLTLNVVQITVVKKVPVPIPAITTSPSARDQLELKSVPCAVLTRGTV